jgi:hypothetical protein
MRTMSSKEKWLPEKTTVRLRSNIATTPVKMI